MTNLKMENERERDCPPCSFVQKFNDKMKRWLSVNGIAIVLLILYIVFHLFSGFHDILFILEKPYHIEAMPFAFNLAALFLLPRAVHGFTRLKPGYVEQGASFMMLSSLRVLFDLTFLLVFSVCSLINYFLDDYHKEVESSYHRLLEIALKFGIALVELFFVRPRLIRIAKALREKKFSEMMLARNPDLQNYQSDNEDIPHTTEVMPLRTKEELGESAPTVRQRNLGDALKSLECIQQCLPHSYYSLHLSIFERNPELAMNDLNHIQQYLTDQYQMDPGPSTSSMPVPNWGSSDSGAPVTPMPPPAPGPIRRRRFSTAKIQPTRIKKVMQSDEEIGRMVASVPVAIGRAMEHFAEKFLQAAAQATHGSNSRTLTPAHMKQAMMANRHFGFLDGVLKEVGAPGLPKVEQDTTRPHQIQLPPNMIGFPGVGLAPGVSPTTSSPLSHLTPDPNLSPGGFPFPLSSPPFSALGHLFPPMGSSQMADLASSPVQSIPLSPSVQQAPSEGSKVGVANGAAQKRTNNKKEPLPNGEKPKRGRPRKIKKDEKCLDEEMFKDVSTVIEKEDKEVKDREMMPPPALPMGGFGRPKPVS